MLKRQKLYVPLACSLVALTSTATYMLMLIQHYFESNHKLTLLLNNVIVFFRATNTLTDITVLLAC